MNIVSGELLDATPNSEVSHTATFDVSSNYLRFSIASYKADAPAVVSAIREQNLTPADVDDRLLNSWFEETRPQHAVYLSAWFAAAKRIGRVDSDFENLPDDVIPMNIADLQEYAAQEVRETRHRVQWYCLRDEMPPREVREEHIAWQARYDACRGGIMLLDFEPSFTTPQLARVLQAHPSIPLIKRHIRLAREARRKRGGL